MKRFMVVLTGVIMAAALAACTPTKQSSEKRNNPPAGATQESSVDGALEKQEMVVDAEPSVTVCIYSVNDNKTGLKQNMDAVDGEELDAQLFVNKKYLCIEEGVKVKSFDNKDGVLTLDLSALSGSKDELVITSIVNTFIQNYEAEEMSLSVNGEKLGSGNYKFVKEYKKMK